mmetsp:Transcript_11357/g.34977  ORF Transcript_11357/g.34977 Transcript_11357/m.34977 type:complete len:201 (+) Transcript_11357:255-857(+)
MTSNKDEESQLIEHPKSFQVTAPKVVGAVALAFCLGALIVSASSPSVGPPVTTANLADYGNECRKASDCKTPPGADRGVCRKGSMAAGYLPWSKGVCRDGAQGAFCGHGGDCTPPKGRNHGVCRSGYCQDGHPGHPVWTGGRTHTGARCGVTADCEVPAGLSHAVCRDDRCQDGKKGASCGVDSDCIGRCWTSTNECGLS